MDTGQTARIRILNNRRTPSLSPDAGYLVFFFSLSSGGPTFRLPRAPSGAKWADPANAYDALVYLLTAPLPQAGYMQSSCVAEGGASRQVQR